MLVWILREVKVPVVVVLVWSVEVLTLTCVAVVEDVLVV